VIQYELLHDVANLKLWMHSTSVEKYTLHRGNASVPHSEIPFLPNAEAQATLAEERSFRGEPCADIVKH
jgi:hypothetical protein